MIQDDADLGDLMKHGRNCRWYGSYGDSNCTCSLELRRALGTERAMHRAWRKRAEEAENKLNLLPQEKVEQIKKPLTVESGAE